MEQITKKLPVYKTVPNGFKTVKFWVTSDGKEFTTKSQANFHEETLKRDEVVKKYNELKSVSTLEFNYFSDCFSPVQSWVYLKDDKDIEIFKLYHGISQKTAENLEVKLEPKDFYGIYYPDGAYSFEIQVLSLSKIRQVYNEFMKKFYE